VAYDSNIERWRPEVERIFREEGGGSFNQEDVEKALWVIQYESSGNPGARSDSGGYGLFQLNDGGLGEGLSVQQRLDPTTNIRTAARAVYGGSGWSPWGEGTAGQAPYNPATGRGMFGALGNHPYPGSSGGGSTGAPPLNGRASVGAGITAGGPSGSGDRFGIFSNLNSGSGNNGGRNLTSNQSSSGAGGIFGNIFGGLGGALGTGVSGLGGNGASGGLTAAEEGDVDYEMRVNGVTREQALYRLGYVSGSGSTDHFGEQPWGDQRDFDESVLRDRRDFDYNQTLDIADRLFLEAQTNAAAAQQQFDNAMAVGDFQAAQTAAADLNHWKQVEATQEQQRMNLTNQGQQLDYNLGLGNIAANRYSTDASLALGNAQNATEAALGQQRNQTGQFDAETARLNSERDYILGMANATTDAERAAIEDRRRQDDVAIANMQGQLGHDRNRIDAFGADTTRQIGNQNYNLGLANSANDAARVGIEDASRLDKNSQFNASEQNAFTLGQQGNRTNQFGAETDRANRMGQLSLENNKFILDASNQARNLFSMYFMQRGLAPDFKTIMEGGTPAQGSALAPTSVMNAYTPTTLPGTFDATAAQSTAQASQNYGAGSNQFLQNWQQANTATTQVPELGDFKAAQGQAGSGYGAASNPFIGQQPSYSPTTQAPTFNYTPTPAAAPSWTGPTAQQDFLPTQTGEVAGPPKAHYDTNPGGLQGGVPLSGLRPGMNLSTVGGGDIKGSDFSQPVFYDQGQTRPIGADDVVKGGSQVWTWYGPGAGTMPPKLANGGLTRASHFITGDDPGTPDGLGQNAELNEPVVGPGGQYMGTRVTPLNPARRSLGSAWGDDQLRMAAGFGLRPASIFK